MRETGDWSQSRISPESDKGLKTARSITIPCNCSIFTHINTLHNLHEMSKSIFMEK